MHFRWFELCTEKIPESDTEGLFQHIPGSGYSPMFDYVSGLIGSWILLVHLREVTKDQDFEVA